MAKKPLRRASKPRRPRRPSGWERSALYFKGERDRLSILQHSLRCALGDLLDYLRRERRGDSFSAADVKRMAEIHKLAGTAQSAANANPAIAAFSRGTDCG